MKKKLHKISLGEYNKHYKYIIFALFFTLLNDLLNGMTYHSTFGTLRLFSTDTQKIYSTHDLIHSIFYFFGTFIISIFFYLIEKVKNIFKNKDKEKNNLFPKSPPLIYSKAKFKFSIPDFLLVFFIWILIDRIIEEHKLVLKHLDFWMFELIFSSYLINKLTKIEIYEHNKISLLINLFPISFKIITIIYTFIGDSKCKNNNKYDYFKYKYECNSKYLDSYLRFRILFAVYWYFVPCGILIYIIATSLKSYAMIKIKWFMDFKYMPAYILLMIYGIMGTIFYLGIAILTTHFKCKENDPVINFSDYFCRISENGNKATTYYDNFSIYFKTTKKVKEKLIEFFVIILGIISFFFKKYYILMIIKYLTPVHVGFLVPMRYFFTKIILFTYNLFMSFAESERKIFHWDSMEYLKQKFILDTFGDIVSFIGFLIYLEIIELNFCRLNVNLRKNIILRSNYDSLGIYQEIDDSLSEDELEESIKGDSKPTSLGPIFKYEE